MGTKPFRIILCLLTVTNLIFASKIVSFRRTPHISFDINTQYDDNIFLFSKEYINDFIHRIRSYRFPFRTYDDLITRIDLSFNLPAQLSSKRTDFNLNYRQYLYLVNTQKSYQLMVLNINQQINNSFSYEIGYLFLPSYLIRYYRNPLGSATDYIGCIFTEHLMTARLKYRLNKVTVTPFIQYEIDKYLKNFRHYDGYALRYGLNASTHNVSYVNTFIGITRKTYFAQGPIPDISYTEDRISVRLTPKLIKSNIKLSTQFQYARRNYTTDNSFEIDPYHRDRIDNKINAYIKVSYQLKRNLQIYTAFEYEQKRVTTPYRIDINEIKDYNNNKYLLGLRLNRDNIFKSSKFNIDESSDE